jgi:hypothetical protein
MQKRCICTSVLPGCLKDQQQKLCDLKNGDSGFNNPGKCLDLVRVLLCSAKRLYCQSQPFFLAMEKPLADEMVPVALEEKYFIYFLSQITLCNFEFQLEIECFALII